MVIYRIRKFNPETDVEAVQGINKACLPENYPRFFFLEIVETGELIGYEMTRIERRVSNFGFGLTKVGHIISIAVLKKYRRLGVAKRLMQAASDALRIRDVNEVFLEVRESNQGAVDLYQKLGYQPFKISKQYYQDGESALVMISKI
ncbi:MAG: GNAT family N-acetyltransferase [Candidatus Heimdallarchaeota archaeon]